MNLVVCLFRTHFSCSYHNCYGGFHQLVTLNESR